MTDDELDNISTPVPTAVAYDENAIKTLSSLEHIRHDLPLIQRNIDPSRAFQKNHIRIEALPDLAVCRGDLLQINLDPRQLGRQVRRRLKFQTVRTRQLHRKIQNPRRFLLHLPEISVPRIGHPCLRGFHHRGRESPCGRIFGQKRRHIRLSNIGSCAGHKKCLTHLHLSFLIGMNPFRSSCSRKRAL